MNFMELLDKMEKFHCEFDLDTVDVSCNKIEDVPVLVFKHENKIFEVIVL